jgi:hypothetical protein
MTELNNLFDQQWNIHHIRNLCLLDGPTNSALSNLTFKKKRKKVLLIDGRGEVEMDGKMVKTFIPVATKNVFLKYYTKVSAAVQFTYWGSTDRTDYEETLQVAVNTYLA